MMGHLDERLDAQQRPPLARCGKCEGEQWAGDMLYEWRGRLLCGDCIDEHINGLTITEKAELLDATAHVLGEK